MSRPSILLLISLLGIACSPTPIALGTEQGNLLKVSGSDFLENYADYHQQKIEMTGYFLYMFENVSLYAETGTETDVTIWLNFSDAIHEVSDGLLSDLAEEKVRVQGVYNKNGSGHLGLFNGELEVTFISNY